MDKIEILKETVYAKPRKISANWTTMSSTELFDPPKCAEPLTEEEESDEIIRRLSAPPKRNNSFSDLQDALVKLLADEIQKEIDTKLLTELLKDSECKTQK